MHHACVFPIQFINFFLNFICQQYLIYFHLVYLHISHFILRSCQISLKYLKIYSNVSIFFFETRVLWKNCIHVIPPPLIISDFVPVTLEFASRVWVIRPISVFEAQPARESFVRNSVIAHKDSNHERNTRVLPVRVAAAEGYVGGYRRIWWGIRRTDRSCSERNGEEKGRNKRVRKRLKRATSAVSKRCNKQKREARRNTGSRNETEKKTDSWWGWFTSSWSTWALLRVSRSVVSSVSLSAWPWRILAPDVHRTCRGLETSDTVLARASMMWRHRLPVVNLDAIVTSREFSRIRKSQTMAPKILLASLLIAISRVVPASSALSPDDHHLSPSHNHKILWPVWYRDRLLNARQHRQDDEQRTVQETTTARSSWTPRIFTTRLSQVTTAPRHHVDHRTLDQKFSGAVAMADYDGTRTIAYAGYHGNHRHQPRETQSSYQVPTTVPTYTRHYSGWVVHRWFI